MGNEQSLCSQERLGTHKWGTSISFVFLVLLCAISGALASFIAKQYEGPGCWRPLRWQMFLLEMNRGAISAFCAKKCKSLLFGENTALPNYPLHHGRCFFFCCAVTSRNAKLWLLHMLPGAEAGDCSCLAALYRTQSGTDLILSAELV